MIDLTTHLALALKVLKEEGAKMAHVGEPIERTRKAQIKIEQAITLNKLAQEMIQEASLLLKPKKPGSEQYVVSRNVLERPITALRLSTALTNALVYNEVHTVSDLLKCTEAQLRDLSGIRQKGVMEINHTLGKLDLRLGMTCIPSGAVRDLDALLDQPISHLELTTRAANCLLGENISTIRQLVGYTSNRLLAVPNVGRRSHREIVEALSKLNLYLGMKPST